ncbi:MAG TPA: PQQ-binding-like beta-propeller repeat protein [Acidobacteriaceae bacterium]|nr:PQQ-binding-like beta-propeller repeat protein [Acidobacteriaceae bacterium]
MVRMTSLHRLALRIACPLPLLAAGVLVVPASDLQAAQAAPAGQSHPPAYTLLPPGEGRAVTIRVCSRCHSPDISARKHLTPQGWYNLVQVMSARGAAATDSEFDEIATYLARSFPSGSIADTSQPAPGIGIKAQHPAIAANFTNSVAETGPMDREGNWPMTGGDPAAMRYSTLDQITPANVSKLHIAWIYHMKPQGSNTAPAASGITRYHMSEDQPLVIGPTMYVASPYSEILALNSATGKPIWIFHIPGGDQCSLRGVAYWPGENGYQPAIIFGTRGGRLYSINARTGRLNSYFGLHGSVNLKTPAVMTTGMDLPYILPSPPVIYKDLIITGAGTGEGPGGLHGGVGPAGDTRAWDARTGKLVWTFHSVPRPGEEGHDSWGGDSWKDRSGVNVWGDMTVDAARGILYMPFGAPNNDRVGIDRPGRNLFGSSVVAVDAATGKLLWYFQIVHHDIWDYDAEAPPTLINVRHGAQTIPAVVVVNKTGLMFILDRVTGKPVYGVTERPVPASNVPGEHTWPTQPFPDLPPPLAENTITETELYNETPEHSAFCKKYVHDNNMLLSAVPYTPPQFNRYSVTLPGTQGGVNYYGGAFDPNTGFYIVNVNNLGQPMRIVRNPDGSYQNSGPLAGMTRFWDPSNHLPCTPLPWGQLVAVNVNTGRIAWRSTLGVTDILPKGKQDTGRPGLGGPIVTAGGLTFIGATDDSQFRAFETRTGKEIWTFRLPAAAEATPITYTDTHGKQYVAVVATGGGLIGAPLLSDSVIAWTLP